MGPTALPEARGAEWLGCAHYAKAATWRVTPGYVVYGFQPIKPDVHFTE